MTTPPTPTVADLAEAAAEAIRAANHRTIIPGHLSVPAAYWILGELSSLAHRLPQLCDQLATNLDRRVELGGLRLDADGQARYPDPAQAIHAACRALHAAADLAGQLGRTIDEAHGICAVLADTGHPNHDRVPEEDQ